MVATFQRNIAGHSMLRAFDHPVATCYGILRQVWRHWLKFKNGKNFHAAFVDVAWCCICLARFVQQCCTGACALDRYTTCRNTSQQGGQTRARQQSCNMLHLNVVIVSRGFTLNPFSHSRPQNRRYLWSRDWRNLLTTFWNEQYWRRECPSTVQRHVEWVLRRVDGLNLYCLPLNANKNYWLCYQAQCRLSTNRRQTQHARITYLYCASGSSTAASCSTQVFACSMFPRSKALLCSVLASDAIQS